MWSVLVVMLAVRLCPHGIAVWSGFDEGLRVFLQVKTVTGPRFVARSDRSPYATKNGPSWRTCLRPVCREIDGDTINAPCFSPFWVLYGFQPWKRLGVRLPDNLEIGLCDQTRWPISRSISLASRSLMGVTILITLRWISALDVLCSFIELHFCSHSSASCFLCWKKEWKLIDWMRCVRLSPRKVTIAEINQNSIARSGGIHSPALTCLGL